MMAFVLLLLSGCAKEVMPVDEPVLVVEGWIDAGGYPVVMLSTTVPAQDDQYIDDLDDHVIRWARVSVSDGEREVVLTGKVDERYTPPYIYTTGKLKGEPGKTYRLTVSYDDFYAEAETYISEVAWVESFSMLQVEGTDKYQLMANLKDVESGKGYYKFFVRLHGMNDIFLPSFLGTVNGEMLTGEKELSVLQPYKLEMDDYTPYFALNDEVSVKFARMDAVTYEFWKMNEELQIVNPMYSNLPTNIRGGIGYWAGYGASTYHLKLTEDGIKMLDPTM